LKHELLELNPPLAFSETLKSAEHTDKQKFIVSSLIEKKTSIEDKRISLLRDIINSRKNKKPNE
jgi:hypothetical protein